MDSWGCAMATDVQAPTLRDYFMPHQVNLITCTERMVIYEKSIRIGITWAMAMRAVRRRVLGKGNYLHTSVTQLIGQSFIHDCKTFCRLYELLFGVKLRESEIDSFDVYNPLEDRKETAFQIVFGPGDENAIKVFSSNPDALRGEGGDVGIDEITSHSQPAELLKAAGGRAMWGHDVYIWSSHRGQASAFNRMIEEQRALGEQSRWTILRTDLYEAIDGGLLDKIAARSGTRMSREEFIADTVAMVGGWDAFEEECLLKPRSGGDAAVGWRYIQEARRGDRCLRIELSEEWPSEAAVRDIAGQLAAVAAGGVAHIGWDVARSAHLAVIAMVVRDPGDDIRVVALVKFSGVNVTSQRLVLDHLLHAAPRVEGLGDRGGLGRDACDQLERAHGENRFKGVDFINIKTDLGTKLTHTFETTKMLLPEGSEHDDIAYDVHAIRTDRLPSGKLRYVESVNPIDKRSHCDMAWALAMATFSAAEAVEEGMW